MTDSFLTLHHFDTPRRRQKRPRGTLKRWIVWGVAMTMLPAIVYAAYQPTVLLVANNLSDLANVATARTNLGLTGAATMTLPVSGTNGGTGVNNGSYTLTLGGSTSLPAAPASTQCLQESSAGAVAAAGAACGLPFSVTTYTSTTTPMTLPSTNMNMEIVSQTTAAAITIDLPSAAANLETCVKDGTNDFATYNATITPGGTSKIDGASTYVMNQAHEAACFISDGTNWFIN